VFLGRTRVSVFAPIGTPKYVRGKAALSGRGRPWRAESGQVTAWTVGLALLLFGIMALTVDVGFWFLERRESQNNADAAALAAVQELPASNTTNARTQALLYLAKNGHTGGSVCNAQNSPTYTFFDAGVAFRSDRAPSTDYETVRVCTSDGGLVVFGNLLGLASVDIRAVAAAGLEVEPSRYALMAMNDDDCSAAPSLHIRGGGSGVGYVELLEGGASYTALDCGTTNTLRVDGNMTLEAEYHDFCGAAGKQGSNSILTGTLNDGVCDVADPWGDDNRYPQPEAGTCITAASLGLPDFAFTNGDTDKTPTLEPGTYCVPIVMSGSEVTLTLEEGEYVFTGGFMATNGSIVGDEVLLYFTCQGADTCEGATVKAPAPMDGSAGCSVPATFCVQGQANLNLTAPDGEPHIVIWVDRTAEIAAGVSLIRIAGQGTVVIEGHIYNWGGGIEIQGQGGGFNFTINGTILGDTIDIAGQGQYSVTWDEEFAPKIFTQSLIE